MPLKVVRRKGSPYWWLSGTVGKQRVRESTGTDRRELAEEKRVVREGELYRAAVHGPTPAGPRQWSFAEAVARYVADRERSRFNKRRLNNLLRHFGPAAMCRDVTLAALEDAARVLLRPGHVPATRLAQVVGPARAVLRYAAERDGCLWPRLKMKVQRRNRTDWLTPAQAERLEAAAPPHLRPLVVFLLATGARMGEAHRLRWEDVDLRHGRATLRDTKNGLDRTVELCPRAVAALAGIDGREDHVFRTARGLPYRDRREVLEEQGGSGQVESTWCLAASRAGLPGRWRAVRRNNRPSSTRLFVPVHGPHSCRHTWATWHYVLNRDVLLLRVEGGWSTVLMVERYAHLAPPGLADEIRAWRARGAVAGTPLAQSSGVAA